MQKRLVLVCEGSLCPRKQPDVSGPGLGEAGAPLNACLINDLRFFPSSLSYLVSLPPHAVSNSRSSCSTYYFAQSLVSQLHVITVFKPDNNTTYYSFGPTHSRHGLLLPLVATPVSHIRLSYNLVKMNTQRAVHVRSIGLQAQKVVASYFNLPNPCVQISFLFP